MDNNILRDLETIRARVAFTPGREAQVRVEKYIADLRAELARARETIEVVAEQRNRALEAVEKLREALAGLVHGKRTGLFECHCEAKFEEELQMKVDIAHEAWIAADEALAATEPATVELPKCDHCGAIACGTDCDGSSHYTPDTAKDGN